MKTNMVAREVPVTVTGVHDGKMAGERELFTEEAASVLVGENGGVIQLSEAVVRGQLLWLTNAETKREVVAQVKRTYQPMNRCVELEFAEPGPRFWGMEFSAATALLPKGAKDAEAAALISVDGISDAPEKPLPAPSWEEVQALKQEVKALRGRTPRLAGTEKSPEVEHNIASPELTATEQELLPKPALDFTMPLPKSKGLFRARGKLTPGAALRLAALSAALVVTVAGALWYWIPRKSTARRSANAPAVSANVSTSVPTGPRETAREHSANTNVTTEAPAILPSKPAEPDKPLGQYLSSTGSAADPGLRRTPAAATPSGKARVRPSGQISSPPGVPSAAQNVVVPPRLIKSVRAVASLDDLHDFETGNVVIDAVVDTDGQVHFITVISGPPSLRRAAVQAVKEYLYEPATRNGQPVPEHVHITIRFRFES